MNDPHFEQIAALAMRLSSIEKVRLLERLAAALHEEMSQSSQPKPRKALYGFLADLGPAPSAEEIDEARREMWKNFPREDIG